MTHPKKRAGIWLLASATTLLLAGCALPLPDKPAHPQAFDLGTPPATSQLSTQAQATPLALADVRAPEALDTRHMVYRLAYAGEDQQPRPYALAQWTMPPAQLVRQRLVNALAPAHPIVDSTSSLSRVELQFDLDVFDQVFRAPEQSEGIVRLRVTAIAAGAGPHRLLGQQLFSAQMPAASADAAGGAAALRRATDAVVRQVVAWIATLPDTR